MFGLEIKIAIPSYKRSTTIASKTLATLHREGFLAHDITIFVANQDELRDYEKNVPRNLYNSLVVGTLGIAKQRNFISRFYPEGTCIVCIDDDIRGFRIYQNTLLHIPTLFQDLFYFCFRNNTHLWGLYPASNNLFFKPRIKLGLHLICGSCYGFINNHSLQCDETLVCKEDYSLSFEVYRHSQTLVRAEFISPLTAYWKTKGGLQGIRNDDNERESSLQLFHKYPELVQEVYTKKNGKPDLRLVRSVPKNFHPVVIVGTDGFYRTVF